VVRTEVDSLLRGLITPQFINDGTPQGENSGQNVRELLSVALRPAKELGLAGFLEVSLVKGDLGD